MKKMTNTLQIKDLIFKEKNDIFHKWFNTYKNIYDTYKYPSEAKQDIYHYYEKYLYNNTNVIKYGVRSSNCQYVYLHAIIQHNYKIYYIMITPKNKYYKEIPYYMDIENNNY